MASFLLCRTGEELLMSRLSGTLMIMRWRAFVEHNGHEVSGAHLLPLVSSEAAQIKFKSFICFHNN